MGSSTGNVMVVKSLASEISYKWINCGMMSHHEQQPATNGNIVIQWWDDTWRTPSINRILHGNILWHWNGTNNLNFICSWDREPEGRWLLLWDRECQTWRSCLFAKLQFERMDEMDVWHGFLMKLFHTTPCRNISFKSATRHLETRKKTWSPFLEARI